MKRFSCLDIVKRAELRSLRRHSSTYCYNKPQYVAIESTARCNLGCAWCIRSLRKCDTGDMSLADFRRIVEQIGRVREIIPFGIGEPLLHPEIARIISLASKFANSTKINSNGMLLNEDMTRKLNSSGLTELVLSIDSPDEEIFSKIRIGADLDKIKQNARFFTSHSSVPLTIHAVLSALTLDSSVDLPQMARDLGATKLTFNILYPTHQTRDLMPNRRKLLNSCEILNQLCRKFGLETDIREILKKEPTNLCTAPLLSTFIDSEGYMTPCCNYPMFRLGNVLDEGFWECWNAEDSRKFRKRVLAGDFPQWCQKVCLSVRRLKA